VIVVDPKVNVLEPSFTSVVGSGWKLETVMESKVKVRGSSLPGTLTVVDAGWIVREVMASGVTTQDGIAQKAPSSVVTLVVTV